jgi:hypothetical protein
MVTWSFPSHFEAILLFAFHHLRSIGRFPSRIGVACLWLEACESFSVGCLTQAVVRIPEAGFVAIDVPRSRHRYRDRLHHMRHPSPQLSLPRLRSRDARNQTAASVHIRRWRTWSDLHSQITGKPATETSNVVSFPVAPVGVMEGNLNACSNTARGFPTRHRG